MATRAEVAAKSLESKQRRALKYQMFDNMLDKVAKAGWGVLVRFSVPEYTEAQLKAIRQEAYKRVAVDRRKLYTTYGHKDANGKLEHLDIAFTWRKKV